MSEVTSNFPQLRFPDFDDKWEEKRLSDIAEKSNVKNRDNEVSSVFTNSATKGVVNQRDFFDKDIANQNNLDGYYIINHDNFVYNPRISFSAPVGPLNRNHLGTGVMSPLYTILKINNVSLDFIERYFKTTKWHRYMNNIANIGARHDRMNIISSDFMKMPIPLPKDEEQQKIAAFLTAFDTKIEQLSKKQELLGEYKKGAMQQIFSQAIRFKADDGSDFPDWKEKKLGDILDYEQPTNYIVDSTEYDNSFDMPVLTAGKSFVLGYTNETHKVFENIPVIIFDDFTTANKYVDFPFKVKSSAMKILKPKDSFVNIRLIFEFIQMLNFPIGEHKRYWISEYQDLKIPFPSFEEQTKIASFLSSIDNKIEQVGKQLDESKQFKKALLQQMFV